MRLQVPLELWKSRPWPVTENISFFVYWVLSLCVCCMFCALTQVYVQVNIFAHAYTGVFLHSSSVYVLRQGLSANQELLNLARWASQLARGSLQHNGFRQTCFIPDFTWMLGSELGSSCLCVRHLSNEPSPSPASFFTASSLLWNYPILLNV